jgi:hypothetical protein
MRYRLLGHSGLRVAEVALGDLFQAPYRSQLAERRNDH